MNMSINLMTHLCRKLSTCPLSEVNKGTHSIHCKILKLGTRMRFEVLTAVKMSMLDHSPHFNLHHMGIGDLNPCSVGLPAGL
jgi:hypothetical protein